MTCLGYSSCRPARACGCCTNTDRRGGRIGQRPKKIESQNGQKKKFRPADYTDKKAKKKRKGNKKGKGQRKRKSGNDTLSGSKETPTVPTNSSGNGTMNEAYTNSSQPIINEPTKDGAADSSKGANKDVAKDGSKGANNEDKDADKDKSKLAVKKGTKKKAKKRSKANKKSKAKAKS